MFLLLSQSALPGSAYLLLSFVVRKTSRHDREPRNNSEAHNGKEEKTKADLMYLTLKSICTFRYRCQTCTVNCLEPLFFPLIHLCMSYTIFMSPTAPGTIICSTEDKQKYNILKTNSPHNSPKPSHPCNTCLPRSSLHNPPSVRRLPPSPLFRAPLSAAALWSLPYSGP